MIRKFLIPAITMTLAALILVVLNLSAINDPAQAIETQDYFVKTVDSDRVLVVEPNLSNFYAPGNEADTAGETLFTALENLKEQYTIRGTQLIQVQRKESLIPNLLVQIDPKDANQTQGIVASEIGME